MWHIASVRSKTYQICIDNTTGWPVSSRKRSLCLSLSSNEHKTLEFEVLQLFNDTERPNVSKLFEWNWIEWLSYDAMTRNCEMWDVSSEHRHFVMIIAITCAIQNTNLENIFVFYLLLDQTTAPCYCSMNSGKQNSKKYILKWKTIEDWYSDLRSNSTIYAYTLCTVNNIN